jgi:hypothetical protein
VALMVSQFEGLGGTHQRDLVGGSCIRERALTTSYFAVTCNSDTSWSCIATARYDSQS